MNDYIVKLPCTTCGANGTRPGRVECPACIERAGRVAPGASIAPTHQRVREGQLVAHREWHASAWAIALRLSGEGSPRELLKRRNRFLAVMRRKNAGSGRESVAEDQRPTRARPAPPSAAKRRAALLFGSDACPWAGSRPVRRAYSL